MGYAQIQTQKKEKLMNPCSNQEEIKSWAQRILSTQPLVLDTETTGLSRIAEPLQIAIIDCEGKTLFNHLIRPRIATIEPGAQAVHGITAEDIKEAHSLRFYHARLEDILRNKTVIIYNAPYDTRILENSCMANQVPSLLSIATWEDLMQPYAEYYGDWSSHHRSFTWQKLTNACSQMGINILDAHSAIGDCMMTLALLKKLAE